MHPGRTAILLFSRTAASESLTKGFGAGSGGDARIVASLIQRTETVIAASGLPLLRSDEKQQRGQHFGDRLTNALSDAFSLGYEQLIVVGNDCPSLLPSHLRAAAQMLEKGQNVIGPDQRGGIWLLGLQKKHFDAKRLAALRWESPALFADLHLHLPAATVFSRLADINTLQDLRRKWHALKGKFATIAGLIVAVANNFQDCQNLPATLFLKKASGRAPPYFS